MSLKIRRAREWLAKRQRQPKRDYPLATMAFYGPTRDTGTKLVAAVVDDEAPQELERWFSWRQRLVYGGLQTFTDAAWAIRRRLRSRVRLVVDLLKPCGAAKPEQDLLTD